MARLRQTDDVEEVRELHELAFEADEWPGDDHTMWIAEEADGRPVGFCSAIREEDGSVFLSRAAVIADQQGKSLQRRMIRVRVAWARRIGVKRVITYTTAKNYPSMVSLLKEGFRFYTPDDAYAGSDKHYFEKHL